jgi:hypothetical protein
MDMKKILQTMDSVSSKPVEGSDNMKQFLSIVTEGVNPHKVALPVQMAMQHYAEPVVAHPKTIKEVKKSAMSNMLYQYYTTAEKELSEEATAKKALISEQARRIADRLLEKDLGKHNNATTGFKALAKKTNSKIAGAQFQKMKKAGQLEESDAEYDQEGRSVKNSLLSTLRAVKGLGNMLGDDDNLPEWCEEKITLAEDYLVTVWDYLQSEQAMQEGHRNYDDNRTGFSDQAKRDFKRDEMEHELGHETNNYAVAIDGKTWKVFASKSHAQAVARSLQNKGKKASVHETGADVSEGSK